MPSSKKENYKGVGSECYIKNVYTGIKHLFQFNPKVGFDIANQVAIHRGIKADKGIPLPSSGGEEYLRLDSLIYKVDEKKDTYLALQELKNDISKHRNGNPALVEVYIPGLRMQKWYVQTFGAELVEDWAENKQSRRIEVSLSLVRYTPLPEPKGEETSDENKSSWYTVTPNTEEKKKPGKSGKSSAGTIGDLVQDGPDPGYGLDASTAPEPGA
jgi:hypothetical protein